MTLNYNVPVYILTVPNKFRGQTLLEYIKKRFRYFHVIEGIDAATNLEVLEKSVDQKAVVLVHGRELLPGEIACHLGHNMIIELICKSNFQWSLVLEDDAEIHNLPDWFLNELKQINSPTIINLNNRNHFRFTYQWRVITNRDGESIKLSKYFRPGTSTFGYLINREAAILANSINSRNRLISTCDWPLLWKYKINFYHPELEMISENSKISIIGAKRFSITEKASLMGRFKRILSRICGIDSYKFKRLGYSFKLHYLERTITPALNKFLEMSVKKDDKQLN
jgi:GR25 family glycosyltransferase involved in LPS biosynthesis